MQVPGRLVGVAAGVVDASGRILLVRHTYGRLNWELPGGMSEPDETFVATALRELREETGLDAHVERLTGLYYERQDDLHHLVFRCVVRPPAIPTPSSPEISACDFFSVDELPRPISDFTIRRMHDVFADSTSPSPRRCTVSAPEPYGSGAIVVFDTSAWNRQRSRPDVVERWRATLDRGTLIVCPIVALELLASARNEDAFQAARRRARDVAPGTGDTLGM